MLHLLSRKVGNKINKMKTYRVEIVMRDDGEVTVIGHGLSERQADRREETGWNRINPSVAFIRTVEE